MKTVYDLYHWTHPDTPPEVAYGFETLHAATLPTGHTDPDAWRHYPGAHVLDENLTSGTREWTVFERPQPQTDTERVHAALHTLKAYSQTEGPHHKAWVIDQCACALAADYDTWVADYCHGENGPHTYTWDRGIAP